MKNCIKCGSHAFNLYAEKIDQGGLCDVHYWQGRAHRAEAQPEQAPVAWMHEWEDGGSVLSLYPRDARLNDQPKSVRPLVYGDTTPPKPEPHNFCPRCGKRLIGMAFAAGGVHTCTPPEGGHQ